MGVNPDILYDLSQLRAQELQQAAARSRLVQVRGKEWLNGWGRPLSAISAVIAKVAQRIPGQARQPVESCC